MKKLSIQVLLFFQIAVLAGFVLVFVNAMPLSLKLTEEIGLPRHVNGENYSLNIKSPSCKTGSEINDIYLKTAMRNAAAAFGAQQGKDAQLSYDFIIAAKDFAYYRINGKDGTAMNVAISLTTKSNPEIIAWEAAK